MHKNIFRNYDIRGKYPEDLDENTAYLVGYHLGKMTSGGKIIIGFDGRISSPSLYNALAQGVIESDAYPISLGLVPTPILYFANKIFSPDAAIMITASHNPKGDNGFKMILHGESFFGEDIAKLNDVFINSDKKYVPRELPEIETKYISEKYIEYVLNSIKINMNLKVGWDPGNGAASEIIAKIIKKLPNQNFLINGEIDGNFPNRPPDPTIAENLGSLLSLVKDNSCDLGIAFDGDADRVVFVTGNGEIVSGDQAVAIFAPLILKENPCASIIADIKSSQTLFDYIASLGGNPIMYKTGHSIIKSKMKETGALLAGELSGHIFFADKYYGYDDGIYAALRMIDLLSKTNESLGEMLNNLPKAYSTSEIKLSVSNSEKFLLIEKIKLDLKKIGKEFIDIDGIRYKNDNGWWIIRASNTEEALTVRAEGISLEKLELVKADLSSVLGKYGLGL